MGDVILLSILSTVDGSNFFGQISMSDLPGSLVVVAFLILTIAAWSVHGGLAQRRTG